jgi:hypothetical protein
VLRGAAHRETSEVKRRQTERGKVPLRDLIFG